MASGQIEIIIKGKIIVESAESTQPPPPPPTGNIINVNPGFEDGLTGYQESANNDQPNAIGISQINPRGGTNHVRVEHTGTRAELMLTNGIGDLDWYKEYWLGVSIYLHSFGTHPAYNTYFQTHGHPKDNDWSNNPGHNGWTLGSKNNYLYSPTPHFHLGVDSWTEAEALSYIPSTGAYTNQQSYYTPVSNLMGRYLDFVLNWKWSPRNIDNPFIKVWMEGAKILDQTGPNVHLLDGGGFERDPYCNIQFGSYKSSGAGNNTLMDFDELRIAEEDGSYDLVNPANYA